MKPGGGWSPSLDRPWLVADIGGTKARFGLVTAPGGRPEQVRIVYGREYPDVVSAVHDYLAGTTGCGRPSAACIAVAGPVTGERFRLTNAPWVFSVGEIRRRLGLEQLEMINDLAALALAVPALDADELRAVTDRPRIDGLPMAVVGIGTGLGVAGVLPVGGGWFPIPGEGGHSSLVVQTDREVEIANVLRAAGEVLSAETVLSGQGLARLHRCLTVIDGIDVEPATPAEVCQRARDGSDPVCVEAAQVFCGLLGAFAGNVALTLGARGAVLLGGGVLRNVAEVLFTSDFDHRFRDKPPMTAYLGEIAVELVLAETPALLGAASWLSQRHDAARAA